MNLKQAIAIVARGSLHTAAADWFDGGWENLPDICEADYERVEAHIRKMLPTQLDAHEQFDDAYAFLEARADKETTT